MPSLCLTSVEPIKVVPDKVVPDKVVPDKVVPGKVVPGKVVPGKVVPGKVEAPIAKYKNMVVPHGKIFVKINSKGQEVAPFAAGQTMRVGITDCAEVPCPGTFRPDVVCWKCKERPANIRR
jgi:hypothetical protein